MCAMCACASAIFIEVYLVGVGFMDWLSTRWCAYFDISAKVGKKR